MPNHQCLIQRIILRPNFLLIALRRGCSEACVQSMLHALVSTVSDITAAALMRNRQSRAVSTGDCRLHPSVRHWQLHKSLLTRRLLSWPAHKHA